MAGAIPDTAPGELHILEGPTQNPMQAFPVPWDRTLVPSGGKELGFQEFFPSGSSRGGRSSIDSPAVPAGPAAVATGKSRCPSRSGINVPFRGGFRLEVRDARASRRGTARAASSGRHCADSINPVGW